MKKNDSIVDADWEIEFRFLHHLMKKSNLTILFITRTRTTRTIRQTHIFSNDRFYSSDSSSSFCFYLFTSSSAARSGSYYSELIFLSTF